MRTKCINAGETGTGTGKEIAYVQGEQLNTIRSYIENWIVQHSLGPLYITHQISRAHVFLQVKL